MASFGLTTAADFLRKLRHERADFVQSECLDPRHALNAVMTGYHLYEWVYPEIAGRTDCPHKDAEAFREAVKAIAGSPIADAGRIANGTKHFKLERIKTGKHKGSFQRNIVQPNAFDVSHLWLERDGHKQRAENLSTNSCSSGNASLKIIALLDMPMGSGAAVDSAVAVERN
jgi:hypothetical protein